MPRAQFQPTGVDFAECQEEHTENQDYLKTLYYVEHYDMGCVEEWYVYIDEVGGDAGNYGEE